MTRGVSVEKRADSTPCPGWGREWTADPRFAPCRVRSRSSARSPFIRPRRLPTINRWCWRGCRNPRCWAGRRWGVGPATDRCASATTRSPSLSRPPEPSTSRIAASSMSPLLVRLRLELTRLVLGRGAVRGLPARGRVALPELRAHRCREGRRVQLEVPALPLHDDPGLARDPGLEKNLLESVRRQLLVRVLEARGQILPAGLQRAHAARRRHGGELHARGVVEAEEVVVGN